MRILIYGAGVLGGNLAANLFKADKDVTLLARGEWADTIRKNGLKIKNGFITRVSRVRLINELKENDIYDVIFVVLRYTQLDSIIDILKANQSNNIVFVGNNVKASYYASLLSDKNVMFAFASSAGHREKDRIVGIDLKKITIGQLKNSESNEKLIKEIFAGTEYKVSYESNMEDYLLCHGAFVLPAAFACYRADGKLSRIKNDNKYLNKVIDASIEGYRAIEKSGRSILPESDQGYESQNYRRLCLIMYKLMCYTPLGKICASDHAMNAVEEMSALNNDFKRIFEESDSEHTVWNELERSVDKYTGR
ncbi:MAG: ketopantoate reductase family protein [Erysipelotrichaceae bacterium]